ncbi:hypothetical protein, partial [Pseudomonas syringae]|uniref:hypothetical protein n=1 Tax=Pseudomonas syringae TaxID=317 RepID=UPI000516BE50
AKATTLDTQPRHRVKGYVSRGQGHQAFPQLLQTINAQVKLVAFEFRIVMTSTTVYHDGIDPL